MSFKKLGVALLAVVVLGAVMANSAFAENEFNETGGQWYTKSGGVETKLSGTLDFTEVKRGLVSLQTTIGGDPVTIHGNSWVGKECSLVNPTSSKATMDCKSVTIDEVTVVEPAGCSVPKTAEGAVSIPSKEITAILAMNKAGTVATLEFTPKEGATLATIELTGASCPIAGTFKLTGALFAKAVSATGAFGLSQEIEFSEAIQKSAGTSTSMKLGANAAFITGGLKATASTEWGGKEK
jgi:hypothetical protein